jgi:hypothetical protein
MGSGARGGTHRAGPVSRNVRAIAFLFLGLAVLALATPIPALCQERAGDPAPAPTAPSLPQLQPPAHVAPHDTPNDRGGSLTITWALSTSDDPADPTFLGYDFQRATSPDGPFTTIDHSPRRTTEAIDAQGVRDGVPYYYRVLARRGEESAPSAVAGPGIASAQWFHSGRLNTLIAVLILSGLIIYYIEHARRGKQLFIRKIAGLDAVDEAVGRATEMGRKILYIPGTQDMDQVQTLAGISILGRVARMTAQYETALDVPVSRSLVMVACRETVKEAYIAEGRPEAYKDDMVHYVTDDQFGYAAAMDGLMVRERPATIFMLGLFYAESLVLAETGNSVGAIQIAGTAEPSQLPFFVAACDYTLIGEELFVAGAYLSREPRQLGSLKGQDMGKAVILVMLLVGVILQTTGAVDFASLFTVE